MTSNEKKTPAGSDPRVGENPGYAEAEPRDREDARDPRPEHLRNPDDGGLDREPADSDAPGTG